MKFKHFLTQASSILSCLRDFAILILVITFIHATLAARVNLESEELEASQALLSDLKDMKRTLEELGYEKVEVLVDE